MNRSLLAFGASAVLLLAFLLVLDPAALAAQRTGTDPGWFALGLILVCLALVYWSEALRPLLADAGGPVSAWRGVLAFSASMCGRQNPAGDARIRATVARCRSPDLWDVLANSRR